MKRYQHNLLAGVAALALFAGAGFASAQEQTKDHAAKPEVAQPHAAQPMNGGQAKPEAKPDRSAQAPNEGAKPGEKPEVKPDRAAQAPNEGIKPGAKPEEKPDRTAQSPNEGMKPGAKPEAKPDRNAQAPNEGTKPGEKPGTEANAHGNVTLSTQQRASIRRSVIQAHNAPRVAHVTFDVRVGTAIPRAEFTTFHVVPVPEVLVSIQPEWRGYEYFVFQDEVVIVDPNTMTIVAVLVV